MKWNINIMGVPEEEQREQVIDNLFEKNKDWKVP